MITVAALCPKEWEFRLVNRNTEDLTDADLDWADLVMIGGMLNQQPDFLYLIELAHLHGKPVCVGGPDVSSSPHLYAAADFQVIGEAEHIMKDFIAAWERGERKGVFTAEKFKIDMTQSPLPRYDLLKLEQYLYIGIQFSRGCPFTCEFCDIIELYGRVPRTKTQDQILAELQALYDAGYRGHVDFVDDNFIGNRKHVRPMMPKLKEWLQKHDYPFEFTTEASINIADDDDMLQSMKDANFFGIFVGIESPDPETLIQMRKKQNTKRNIAESIHKIYSYGMFVTAGFILGFDTEKVSIAQLDDRLHRGHVACRSAWWACSTRCPARSSRAASKRKAGCTRATTSCGSSARATSARSAATSTPSGPCATSSPTTRQCWRTCSRPEAYAGRLKRMAAMMDRSGRPKQLADGDIRKGHGVNVLYKIMQTLPEVRGPFWKTFVEISKSNPDALRQIVTLMAIYLHLGPFSKHVIGEIDRRIRELDEVAPPTAAEISAYREAVAAHA